MHVAGHFGVAMTNITSFQKIFMIVGPPRSGKGTIGRLLTAILGKDNVVNPTLGGMTGELGVVAPDRQAARHYF